MVSSRQRYFWAELVIRILLIVIFLVTEEMTPFKRIIQPEEWWLYKNPYAKQEVVNTSTLFLIALLSPFLTIFMVNYLGKRKRQLAPAILAASMALCLNGCITNLIKLMVGRPRPDFFFRCFPDGKLPKHQPSTYDLKCTGDPALVLGGRKSFPSGHSSFAFTGLGFSAIYVAGQLRCFSRGGRGSSWRLLLALAPLLVATAIAITRTSDYRHHWQDVIVGSMLGFLITFTCYRQHYPSLSDDECDAPYMRSEPGDITHSQSVDKLSNVFVRRDI